MRRADVAGRWVLVPVLMLSACTVTFEKPNLPFRPPPPPNPLALSLADVAALGQFEVEQRAAALGAQAAGRFRDAQAHWSAVLTLKPADGEAQQGRQLAIVSAQSAAGEAFDKVQPARAKGDLESAQRWALETLVHDAEHKGAVAALRELQRERNRRLFRGDAVSPSPRLAARGKPNDGANNELEHAALLADAGETDGALQILLPLAEKPGASAELRSRACGLLVQQARSRMASDRKAALQALETCLKWQPRHPEASRLAQALRSARLPPR